MCRVILHDKNRHFYFGIELQKVLLSMFVCHNHFDHVKRMVIKIYSFMKKEKENIGTTLS